VRGWRWLRLAVHLALGMATAALLFPLVPVATRRGLRRRWSAGLLALLGVELQAAGAPIRPGGLLVANHISWLDIFVINALAPAAFVSKAEVRTWPIIGWFAARNETVFLRRGSRGHAKIINAEIGALLDAGRNVAIFPEGTTTDGSHVLHFHAALLQPAIESGHPVQPVALSYHTPDGGRSRAPAYDGDVSLGQCLAAIVAEARLIARIEAAAPMATGADTNRRELARRARDMIVTAIECGGRQTPDTTPAAPHGAEPAAADLRIPA
jgi:1-acyl-sn-glycerol-3-phosphate acyltransferase